MRRTWQNLGLQCERTTAGLQCVAKVACNFLNEMDFHVPHYGADSIDLADAKLGPFRRDAYGACGTIQQVASSMVASSMQVRSYGTCGSSSRLPRTSTKAPEGFRQSRGTTTLR
jgi:hypothetical protein